MIHCHELSEHSVKFAVKYFQTFPEVNDVIFSAYKNEANIYRFNTRNKKYLIFLELMYP